MPSNRVLSFFALFVLYTNTPLVSGSLIFGSDLRFQISSWTMDTSRARGGPASQQREIQNWWLQTSAIMSQVKDVSWSLQLEDLMPSGPASASARLDNPDLDGKEQDMTQFVQCINEQYQPSDMSWDAFDKDEQGAFKVVGAWWTNHAPKEPVTVVTSASVSRLSQLYAQCLSWSGPLSAVLYLPLSNDRQQGLSAANQAILRVAVVQVSQFLQDMQGQTSACKPDIILMYEMYKEESARQLLYPCNVPRNLARLQARTPLVALVDVDLVLSHALSKRVSEPREIQRLVYRAVKDRTVFIIPAFDVRGQNGRAAWADALVSPTSTKELLVYAFEHNVVFQFAADTYPVAHAMTNYAKWKTADEDYPTKYREMSEPWILGDRLALPWHDARYRGYGLNKQQFIANVNASGFKFRVLHDAYTVHRAHKKNKAKDVFIKGITARGPDPRLFAHNAALFKAQLKKHKIGTYAPRLNRATAHCLSILPWWRNAPMHA